MISMPFVRLMDNLRREVTVNMMLVTHIMEEAGFTTVYFGETKIQVINKPSDILMLFRGQNKTLPGQF